MIMGTDDCRSCPLAGGRPPALWKKYDQCQRSAALGALAARRCAYVCRPVRCAALQGRRGGEHPRGGGLLHQVGLRGLGDGQGRGCCAGTVPCARLVGWLSECNCGGSDRRLTIPCIALPSPALLQERHCDHPEEQHHCPGHHHLSGLAAVIVGFAAEATLWCAPLLWSGAGQLPVPVGRQALRSRVRPCIPGRGPRTLKVALSRG